MAFAGGKDCSGRDPEREEADTGQPRKIWVQGLGFRVQGLGSRV